MLVGGPAEEFCLSVIHFSTFVLYRMSISPGKHLGNSQEPACLVIDHKAFSSHPPLYYISDFIGIGLHFPLTDTAPGFRCESCRLQTKFHDLFFSFVEDSSNATATSLAHRLRPPARTPFQLDPFAQATSLHNAG